MSKVTLTVAKCKELCRDFHLINHVKLKKKACLHLMEDAEMCRHDAHFICELVLYKQRSAARDVRNGAKVITSGGVNLLSSCPRKFHLEREKFMKPPSGEPRWKKVSDAFNKGRARIDATGETNLDNMRSDISPLNRAKVRASLRFYANGHHAYGVGSTDPDQSVQFEFEGAWYQGFASAITKDGDTIYAWRYGKEAPDVLKLSYEAAVLLQGVPGANRYVSILMKKPQHRPKRSGESMVEFENRIVEALENKPGGVMTRLQIPRDLMDIEGVLRQMRAKMDLLPELHAAGMPSSHTDCGMCDFGIVCESAIGVSTNEIVRILTLRKDEE